MKPDPTFRLAPILAGAFLLCFSVLLCFFCWQYITATWQQASEELVHSLNRVEARLLSGN